MNRGGAIIFDMDDTLAATGPIWRAAEVRLLASIGLTHTPELAAHYKGMNILDVAATIHGLLHPDLPLDELKQRARLMLLEEYESAPIAAVDGAVALVRRLAGLAPMAVASGSPLPGIHKVLDKLAIRECFAAVITSEAVTKGKPSPDVFLHAADALAVLPHRCVVFEDSLVGAQAARAAGMRCIVRPSMQFHGLEQVATRIVGGWDEVRRSDISAFLEEPT